MPEIIPTCIMTFTGLKQWSKQGILLYIMWIAQYVERKSAVEVM